MRYTSKRLRLEPLYQSKGNRIISKFALFPITINGQTRWLENVNVKQEVSCESLSFLATPPYKLNYYWRNIDFIA